MNAFKEGYDSYKANSWHNLVRKYRSTPKLEIAIRGYISAMNKEINMDEHQEIGKQIKNLKLPLIEIVQIGDLFEVKGNAYDIGVDPKCAGHLAEVVAVAEKITYRMLDQRLRFATFIDPENEVVEFFGRVYGNQVCYFNNHSHQFWDKMYPFSYKAIRFTIDTRWPGSDFEKGIEPKFNVGDKVLLTEHLGCLPPGINARIKQINPIGPDTFLLHIVFLSYEDSFVYVKKSQVKKWVDK